MKAPTADSVKWAARYPRQWVRWRWCELRAWLDAGPWLTAVPYPERCFMGAPFGIQCRRPAVDETPWCVKHAVDVPR